MLNVFTNLIQKGTLCDIKYIFGDQGIEGKLIFYNFTELYQNKIFHAVASRRTNTYVYLSLIYTLVLYSEPENDSLRDKFLAVFKLRIVVKIQKFSLETIDFSPKSDRPEHEILAMIDDNSLKTQDILSNLVAFDSIRLTLQVYYKNMYLSVKNNLLYRTMERLSLFYVIPGQVE